MKNIFYKHGEKFFVVIVCIICLILIASDVNKYLIKEKEKIQYDELMQEIQTALESTKEPVMPEIVSYEQNLKDIIEGKSLLVISKISQGLVYPREFSRLIPVMQKPRFVLLPPKDNIRKGDAYVKVEPGFKIVTVSFENDDIVSGFVRNTFKNPLEDGMSFEGHVGVVFGGVLQRKLMHNGKKDITDSSWLTLSGSKENPAWKNLENPLQTTFVLQREKNAQTRRVPVAIMERGFDMRANETGRHVKLRFSFDDIAVEEFKSYEYRMAIIGAVQKGVRVFNHGVTDEEKQKDWDAVKTFEQSLYEPGLDFMRNPTIEKILLLEYGVEGLGYESMVGTGVTGGQPGAKVSVPFFLVRSSWSKAYTAKVKADSIMVLSGQFGQGGIVSIYVLKHYRYTFTKEGKQQTAVSDLLQSFTHSLNDRIGKEPRLRRVRGREFMDKEVRMVDFTTPYELVKIDRADRVIIRRGKELVPDEDGKLVIKEVQKREVQKDVLYIKVRNVITDEIKKHWLVGTQVINTLRAKAAERLRKEKQRIEEKEKRKKTKRDEHPLEKEDKKRDEIKAIDRKKREMSGHLEGRDD